MSNLIFVLFDFVLDFLLHFEFELSTEDHTASKIYVNHFPRHNHEQTGSLTYGLSFLVAVVESSVQGSHARVSPAVLQHNIVSLHSILPSFVGEEEVVFVLHICLLQVNYCPLTVYYATWCKVALYDEM